MVLKLAVFSSGVVLADGASTTLDRLDQTLADHKATGGPVWYYREAAADPQATAMEVIRLIARHKLPVSMSSKADFSDYLDAKGISHPRDSAASPDIDAVFAQVRRTAAGEQGTRGLVVVRPDNALLLLPALEESPSLTSLAAGMERMIPSQVKRNIAVIATTAFATDGNGIDLAGAGKAIPFLGLLMGLSYIGHHVWVFEAQKGTLAAGCREADVLVVDSAFMPRLSKGWEPEAARAMSNANILVHDRATSKLRVVRKMGERRDRLEFLC
jgi:hypothetical protein